MHATLEYYTVIRTPFVSVVVVVVAVVRASAMCLLSSLWVYKLYRFVESYRARVRVRRANVPARSRAREDDTRGTRTKGARGPAGGGASIKTDHTK